MPSVHDAKLARLGWGPPPTENLNRPGLKNNFMIVFFAREKKSAAAVQLTLHAGVLAQETSGRKQP